MSRHDDDDEDDRPRSRRRREDDEDDRPPRRRRRDDEDDEDDFDDSPRSRTPGGSNGMAVTGLVLGFLSLCTGFLAGIPAIICSVVAMKKPTGKGMAVTGLVLGTLGTTVGSIALLIGLLLPAVSRVREAAARAKDSNNLKMIGIGFFSHHDAHRNLPPATGDLSWRVHLLPFFEQQALYNQFDLNQPWNAPRNRIHADVVVREYQSTLDGPNATATRYRVFVGQGTIYEPGRAPKRFSEFRDGTGNTLLAIEAAETVPWPEPRELPYTPDGPLPEIGHPNRGTALVLMADGAVRPVNKKIDRATFRAIITPAGGEQVPSDW